MAKKHITPMIDYANDFYMRREMIWAGLNSFSRSVKDKIAYLNRKEKKFGPLVKNAAGIAYEFINTECLAVCIDKIDERLCAENDWRTLAEIRDEDILKLKKDLLDS